MLGKTVGWFGRLGMPWLGKRLSVDCAAYNTPLRPLSVRKQLPYSRKIHYHYATATVPSNAAIALVLEFEPNRGQRF